METRNVKNIFYLLTILICSFIQASSACGQSVVKPKFIYLNEFSLSDTTYMKLKGPARIITFDGRKGLNTTSSHSVLKLKAHNMNENQGTVSLWVMPLEELSTYSEKDGMKKNNPQYDIYPFLSDYPNQQDANNANFKLIYRPGYHPSITAQFAKGTFYEQAFNLPHKAIVSVSHFAFKAKTWYQLILSWNYEKDQYSLFVNGILIGREDQYRLTGLQHDIINTSLYLGNPALCYSDIKFYDRVLSNNEIYSQFKNEVVHFDKELEDELLYTYSGKGRSSFEWKPNTKWLKKFDLSLSKPSDLDSFYIQGNPADLKITDDGLLIETINKEYTEALLDSQVYVWSCKPFEGDLYVEYEFKVLRRGGLSLLMVQSSGMNREDFMADYPLRTSGRMSMVAWEDVRNYHWEYYREMADMRNDVDNSALMKNPFLYPLSFGSLNKPIELNKWHKLQFLQMGNKLIGSIDGIVMVESTDNGFSNNGPVYDFGRIAIRCMLRTKMLFRNIKVYNRTKIQTEKLIKL